MISLDGVAYATRQQAVADLTAAGQHVTVGMLRDWEARGVLPRAATVGRSPYFRMVDVYRAEASTRRHANSRRADVT